MIRVVNIFGNIVGSLCKILVSLWYTRNPWWKVSFGVSTGSRLAGLRLTVSSTSKFHLRNISLFVRPTGIESASVLFLLQQRCQNTVYYMFTRPEMRCIYIRRKKVGPGSSYKTYWARHFIQTSRGLGLNKNYPIWKVVSLISWYYISLGTDFSL